MAGVFLLVDLAQVFDVASVLDLEGIKVGPVHEPTQIIPFVHSAKLNSVAYTDRHALGQVDIVGNQYCLAIAHIQDKALVLRSFVVVGQQAPHNSVALYPGAGIILAVFALYGIAHFCCSFLTLLTITR